MANWQAAALLLELSALRTAFYESDGYISAVERALSSTENKFEHEFKVFPELHGPKPSEKLQLLVGPDAKFELEFHPGRLLKWTITFDDDLQDDLANPFAGVFAIGTWSCEWPENARYDGPGKLWSSALGEFNGASAQLNDDWFIQIFLWLHVAIDDYIAKLGMW